MRDRRCEEWLVKRRRNVRLCIVNTGRFDVVVGHSPPHNVLCVAELANKEPELLSESTIRAYCSAV